MDFDFPNQNPQTIPSSANVCWRSGISSPKSTCCKHIHMFRSLPSLKLTVHTCQVSPSPEASVFQPSIFRCELLVSGRVHNFFQRIQQIIHQNPTHLQAHLHSTLMFTNLQVDLTCLTQQQRSFNMI